MVVLGDVDPVDGWPNARILRDMSHIGPSVGQVDQPTSVAAEVPMIDQIKPA